MKNFQIWKSKIYEVFQDLGYMRFEHTSRVYEIYRGVYLNYKEDKGYVVRSFAKLIEDGVYQKGLFEDLK